MFDVASPRVNGDGSFGGFIGSAIDVTDQKLAQQALEKVSGQLIEAQEKERSRIARDLHDDICQRLALLSMEIQQANRSSNESPGLRKRAWKIFGNIAPRLRVTFNRCRTSCTHRGWTTWALWPPSEDSARSFRSNTKSTLSSRTRTCPRICQKIFPCAFSA